AVNLYGLSANNFYFKTLLDNLKVNAHVFRVGTYKSAVEPFIRNDMSNEARENTYRWINSMWNNYVNDVASNREQLPNLFIPKADIFLSQIKSVNGNFTQYALEYDLVDKIAPYYQFEEDMQQAFNKEEDNISIYDYQLSSNNKETQTTKPEIAVVFINGTITEGENGGNNVGSDSITEQLSAIRRNDNVKAVIIRVNSPGGSVTASETIRNEIQAIRNQDIPVVISMGGMAASGGYWISTASDYIFASKNTITGSIGIFGIIPTFENTLAHIGI
ncbi:MAG: signal peptide peptidase SppA, partial [Candidatus Schmidhempelia sp.]|nr:signal peptide peptidase SppA [Candidatus Schmidhempelia sp.]